MSCKAITESFPLDSLPEGARVHQVGITRPLPGGEKCDYYSLADDGTLTAWHYCKPPHERETTINSSATWTCPYPGCGEIWTLQVRTFYLTSNRERDNATAYDY